jgi:hypothetical protein
MSNQIMHVAPIVMEPAAAAPPAADVRDFSAIYDAWFDAVHRWVRALGGPSAERHAWSRHAVLLDLEDGRVAAKLTEA